MSIQRTMLLLMAILPGVVAAQESAPPPAITPEQAAVLDFEDIKAWRGVEADTGVVASGAQSARWTIGPETNRVRTTKGPVDLSWAEAMSIQVHLNEAAPDASIALILASENDASEGSDYWQTTLRCDFTGWKTFEVPTAGFRALRSPAGWDKIDSIMLASDGYGIAAWLDAGTVVHVDNLQFLAASDRATATPPEYVDLLGFEDFRGWEGLMPDSEQPRNGQYSGRWDDMATNTRVRARRFPTDLAPYSGFTLSVYAPTTTPVEFAVLFFSENGGADGPDYYQHVVRTTVAGWQTVEVPFESLRVVRSPLGWDKITGLRLASSGYGLKNPPGAGAMVKLDDFAFVPRK